jgi:hypothetical protein
MMRKVTYTMSEQGSIARTRRLITERIGCNAFFDEATLSFGPLAAVGCSG